MTTEKDNATPETLREQIVRVLTTSEFGKGCIRTVAQLKGLTEEEATKLLIEESIKQEEAYQARSAEPNLILEMDPQLGMLLARVLGHTRRETVADCGFTRPEVKALYRLYDQLCDALVGDGTIRPDGTITHPPDVVEADTNTNLDPTAN